jgi:hypothetical protein
MCGRQRALLAHRRAASAARRQRALRQRGVARATPARGANRWPRGVWRVRHGRRPRRQLLREPWRRLRHVLRHSAMCVRRRRREHRDLQCTQCHAVSGQWALIATGAWAECEPWPVTCTGSPLEEYSPRWTASTAALKRGSTPPTCRCWSIAWARARLAVSSVAALHATASMSDSRESTYASGTTARGAERARTPPTSRADGADGAPDAAGAAAAAGEGPKAEGGAVAGRSMCASVGRAGVALAMASCGSSSRSMNELSESRVAKVAAIGRHDHAT